jgi:phage-related minor tail protein
MASLGALSIKITGDITQFNKDISSVEKQLNKQTAGLSKVAKSMTTVGDSMVKGITVPILAVGAGLLKLGEDFDAAYDKIRIGTGKTGKELESLNDDFRAVAKVAPSAFGDIGTAIAGYSSKLGLAGKPLQDLSTQILNLSRLTKTDLNTNIDQSAKLFNNWKISTENQSKTLDLMFRASQTTGIEIGKLMSEVASSGPILRTMGYDLETSTALIAGFDKAGVDVSSTIAGMKKALVTMAKEGMGDPQEVLAMYVEKIKGAKTDIEAVSIAAELFGPRGGAAMAASIREGRLNLDDLVASLKIGTDSINGASAATMDWQEKLVLLKNNLGLAVEPLASKVFESLGRMIEGVTPKIESLAESFGNLSPEMADNVLKWGLITAAIPLLVSGMGRGLTATINLAKGIGVLNTALKSSAIFGAAGISLPIAAIVAGLVEAGIAVWSITDTVKKSEAGLISWQEKWLRLAYPMMAVNDLSGKAADAFGWVSEKGDGVTATYRNAGVEAGVFQNAMYGAVSATEAGTTAAEEQTQAEIDLAAAKEVLITATNNLYDSLFNEYLLNADISEGLKAAGSAYDEYTAAVKNHGINSDEAKAKEEAWVRVIDGLTATSIPELINKTGALTAEEVIHLQGMQAQIDKAFEMGILLPAEYEKVSKSISDKIYGTISPALQLMYDKMDALDGKNVTVSIGLDTSGFYAKLSQAQKDFYDAKGWSGGGVIASLAKGGIIGNIKSASAGMITPSYDNGGILSMLHKNEVVLNAGQTQNLAKLIFGLANTKTNVGTGTGSGATVNIYPQWNQDFADLNTVRLIKQELAKVL